MRYFVSEDVAHRQVGGGAYVSRCGWEYDADSVDWAGDDRPEAWEPCSGCHRDPGRAVHALGIYAVADDAHAWVQRDNGVWRSACGRADDDAAVVWASFDDEWPDAYAACRPCRRSHFEVSRRDAQPEQMAPAATSTSSLPRSSCDYRMWVVVDGTQHRVPERTSETTMCGGVVPPSARCTDTLTAGVKGCSVCDQAVGRARAEHGIGKGVARRARLTAKKKQQAPGRTAKKKSGRIKKAATPVAPSRSTGWRPWITIVSGGATGLGKRR